MTAIAAPYHHGNLAEDILRRAAEIIDREGLEALTLRGIARDLGVSHAAPNRHFKNKAALLAALATDGWLKVAAATLDAAEATGSTDPHVRLNAMGRGFLRWGLANRALFRTVLHPDVARFTDDRLKAAIHEFNGVVQAEVEATQKAGRHRGVALPIVSLYTNAVPFGAAMLLINPLLGSDHPELADFDQELLIEQVINLVVPLPAQPEDAR